ncbi:Gfo/Idh/MocA family protein [Oharaeibacter diazotrophicus]|uniref:Putative dehydrogenase n=1 Tax=Oharaeibacter diazotrophicus TaxID=1920512 RepID=A0A4R6RCZ6_9HYPH|nr:Gfo/Idh/MocA family oxidoreductase [Oharaeibacter diazotrophicus]TDP83566.1 putative dehydrogenase [Oharaeibacter diazotrophicus]BBE72399.1 1,5-anhydro-D-fructose reductase [Pleomorphomonas sp. SM30]GLS79169.1 deoxyfructose oxidoreductase [Oharaeibacter diazotrophicus]
MSSIEPVRLGVVSTAKIARDKVIPGLRTTPWVEVAAIASRDADRAAATAAALGIPTAYGSYEALFADPTIEAVYIPTPNDSHVDLSLAAARAGKHVLCEKPAGMNAADAARLRAIPEGIVWTEAFMVRQHPQWLAVRDMVRAGRIGRPIGVQVWFSYDLHDPDNIRNRPENGGGALLDIGCYPIVVSRFVLDAEPLRVAAAIDRDATFGTDRLTSALIDFGAGRHLTFQVATQSVPHQRVDVVGTAGRLQVMIPFNAPQGEATVIRFDDGVALGDAGIETIILPPSDQYGLEGEAFAKVIRGVEPAVYGVDDAIVMMTILEATERAAREGRWVEIDRPV